MSLGIDERDHIVYEGHIDWGGRPIIPSPNVFGIQIAETPEQACTFSKRSPDPNRLVFREDGFDPVSMVRRGRIYERDKGYPTECHVYPINQAELIESRIPNGVVKKELICYQRYPLHARHTSQKLYAAIGDRTAYSMWRIVSNDATCFGEELVTMRPLYYLGTLPDLSPERIPDTWRAKVAETVGKVVGAMHRADANSIVELCRHGASAALLAYLDENIQDMNKTDLSDLAKKAEQAQRRLIANSAKMLADLHSRVKPNMQMHLNCRPISDRDAELAVQCLSFILTDLGYAHAI